MDLPLQKNDTVNPTILLAIELSASTWLAAARVLGSEKSHLHRIDSGDTAALLALISSLLARVARRLDAEGMLRVFAAYLRGDHQACSMVRVPTPDEEDAKRTHRERENLVHERLRIKNRIEALLFT